ncbi:signal transduction histidine kinase [Caldalkalibacillus uzonensis]|uniref:histidine kinase n=1 Tax=Caldalkalibacillus uzonensis TaxID=353224 RepID=A0ABU0CSP4_9BACI|nr:ATP-binding protein [Caldalkalibacillus uzonensis]MDQ0339410.1 signal transduction histidine kinase [Caldalkalibacillus uzonensis]
MTKWLGRSLFRRLLISYLITVLLGLGVMGTVISFLTTSHITQTKEQEMLRQAKRVNATIQHTDQVTEQMKDTLIFLDSAFDARIWVFNERGEIIASSMPDEVFVGREMSTSIVEQVMQGQDVIKNLNIEGLPRPMMSVVVPWGEEDQLYGGIVLHSPIEGIESTFRNLRETVLWAMLFAILVTTVMVSYLSWSISRPLRHIEQAANEIALGNYRKRVQEQSADEIGELAKSFNHMAEKLEQVENERQAQEQKRDEFLANISHELRTPLTSMQGFLEALQDGLVKDEESKRRYYDVMYRETMHLNRLVDDMMDLIKLEKGDIKLEPYHVQVGEIIEKVVFLQEAKAEERHNEIHVDYPDDLPALWADPVRLEQIFNNLLGNAIKFTENGTIRITIRSNHQSIIVSITDTGIGIPSHDLPKIWDRFFKVNRMRSKKEGGTGLGLAIVKELVELHGGTIEVQSEVGKGTTFTVTFPLRRAKA